MQPSRALPGAERRMYVSPATIWRGGLTTDDPLHALAARGRERPGLEVPSMIHDQFPRDVARDATDPLGDRSMLVLQYAMAAIAAIAAILLAALR